MYNILICDDEKDIVNALKIYLGDSQYQFLEAYQGKQALEIIEKEEIHLVFMDYYDAGNGWKTYVENF